MIGAYILLVGRGSQKPISTIPNPVIPKQITGEINLTPKFTEADFKFPSSLPVLNVDKGSPFTEAEAIEIGKKFGLTTTPEKADDVFDGTTYFWANDTYSLFIYSKSRRIEYSIGEISKTADKQLSDQSIIDTATRFLNDKGLANSQDIEFSFFSFLKENASAESINITTKDNAGIYQVNFSPITAGSKILTLDPKSSFIYVWVLPNGEIAKASVTKFQSVSKSPNSYPIKNYSQVISSIKSAVVVSLNDGNIHLPNLTAQNIKNIDITSIDLAYLMDSPNTYVLQPVFTLKGTVEFVGDSQKYSAYLYLPAIQNP